MEETIELRDIINIILKGKWIIILCTVVALLTAAVFSWFTQSESYTSTATVQITNANPTQAELADVTTKFVMSEYTPIVYTQRLQKNAATIGAVSSVNEINTDLISLTSTAGTAEQAQQQLQQAIEATTQDFTASMDKSLTNMSEEYLKEADKLSVEVEELMQSYNEIVRANKLPGILLLQTMLTDDISLTLTNEQLAPLTKLDGTLQNELLQLKAQIDIKSEQYRKLLGNYQSVKSGKDSFQIEQYIRTIVEPSLPAGASSPNKKLNLAIGLVLGLMAGIGIVLFRSYWRATAK